VLTPLTKLFDVYATGVILIALGVISILIIFDTSIKLSAIKNLFSKKIELPVDEQVEPKITGIENTPPQPTKSEEREAPKPKVVSANRRRARREKPQNLK
jgi:hypothetical protein